MAKLVEELESYYSLLIINYLFEMIDSPYFNGDGKLINTEHLTLGVYKGIFSGADVDIKVLLRYGHYGVEMHKYSASENLAPELILHKILKVGG